MQRHRPIVYHVAVVVWLCVAAHVKWTTPAALATAWIALLLSYEMWATSRVQVNDPEFSNYRSVQMDVSAILTLCLSMGALAATDKSGLAKYALLLTMCVALPNVTSTKHVDMRTAQRAAQHLSLGLLVMHVCVAFG